MGSQLQSAGGRCSNFLRTTKYKIGDGDVGVYATVRMMQSVTFGAEGVGSPYVRQAALDAVRGLDRGMDEISSIFEYVKNTIEFRGEYAETIQTPQVTLLLGAGDCDDHSTLTAAMLESLGFETRFNTISTGADPDAFTHVYTEVKDKTTRNWLPIDTTVRTSFPGWQPRDIRRTKVRSTRPAIERGGLGDLFWIGLVLVEMLALLKAKRR